MGSEKPDSLEDVLENQRKMSSVSYNVYDTITSTTSDSSSGYFVYDTISSTAVRPFIFLPSITVVYQTGMTMLGVEGNTGNESCLDLAHNLDGEYGDNFQFIFICDEDFM